MITGFAAVYIFILAAFVGYEVISRVPVILHTPLMSGSNFVHGIVVVGAMVALGTAETTPSAHRFLGRAARRTNAVRWLLRHRAHARDVQELRRPEEEGAPGSRVRAEVAKRGDA
jgi:NAD(P) transhydrogenase subunit alpha